MSTVIRFSRQGTKKKPFFRLVVQDKRSARDGRFIENIGTFNPLKGLASLNVARPRLDYWLSVGAQMSDTVKNTLSTMLKQLSQPGVEVAPAPAAKPAARASSKTAKAKPSKKKES